MIEFIKKLRLEGAKDDEIVDACLKILKSKSEAGIMTSQDDVTSNKPSRFNHSYD